MSPTQPKPWFKKVIFYTVLSSLCPLIPVPFVDEAILKREQSARRCRGGGELESRYNLA